MIGIVNSDVGNIGSIANMLKKIGAQSFISSKKEEIRKADKIILSGVGSFDSAIEYLNRIDLVGVLHERVIDQKVPILGICLGMQILTNKSEEGVLSGLGFIDALTVKFKIENTYQAPKIPHMGWNSVDMKKNSLLYDKTQEEKRFYFLHSYHVICNEKEDVLTTTAIEGYEFISSFEKNNIIGVQFHPEKSHKFGMELLKNFTENY